MYVREWHRSRLPFPAETGKGVTIGIVDDVCEHPDITSTQTRTVWFVDGTEDNWTQADFHKYATTIKHLAHGLAVSSVTGSNGRFPGVAPDANLLLIKAVCKKGKENRSVIGGIQEYANLINWVVGKKDEYNIRILVLTIAPTGLNNMIPWQACPLARAVEYAADNNILVITAAHNTPFCSPPSPAISPSTLTVGGVTGTVKTWKLYHHCWGKTIDGRILPEILAPADGPCPLPPFLKSEPRKASDQPGIGYEPSIGPGYTYGDGTSEATPFVAGVVALCLEANPALSARDLKTILLETADRIPYLPAEKQGYGLVNPQKAVALAKKTKTGAIKNPINEPTANIKIPESLESADESVQNAALIKLFTKTEHTVELAQSLVPLLRSQVPKAVCAALLVLAKFPELRNTVQDSGLENNPSPNVRCAWGQALATQDDRITIEVIKRLLQDKNQNVRLVGSQLSSVGTNPELLPDLIQAMQEEGNWPVFCGVRASAERISGQQFVCQKKSEEWNLAKEQHDIATQWKQWIETKIPSFDDVKNVFNDFDTLIPKQPEHKLIVYQYYDFDIINKEFTGYCYYKIAELNTGNRNTNEMITNGDCPLSGGSKSWSETGTPIQMIQKKEAEKKYLFKYILPDNTPPGEWSIIYFFALAAYDKVWWKYPHHVEWTKIGQKQTHMLGRPTGNGLACIERFLLPAGAQELEIQPLQNATNTKCKVITDTFNNRRRITFVSNAPESPEVIPFTHKVEFIVKN